MNQPLSKTGQPAAPIRSDSREQEFLHSVPVVAGGRYILFGAGDMGAKLDRHIQEVGGRVICYVDDNPQKQGSQSMGKPVLPLSALPAWRPLVDGIVVAGLHVKAMHERLIGMGYEHPRDILLPMDLEAQASPPAVASHSNVGAVSNAQYECPVCMLPVVSWKPFTRLVGKNQCREEPGGRLCPYCASFERTRHFWLFLGQRGLLNSRPRFLHIAPEVGLSARLRAVLGERYTTADLTMPHVDKQADLTALPFAADSFDFIYCSNVLEHVPDDRKAMRELFRVLAPGGLAYIQVPAMGTVTQEDLTITDPVRRTELYGQADHVRMYGSDIADRLQEAGFAVETGIMPDLLHLPPEQQTRFNCAKREMIHLCHKTSS